MSCNSFTTSALGGVCGQRHALAALPLGKTRYPCAPLGQSGRARKCIRSLLTYAAPVWSNTSFSSYRRLQILQSKCLRVIGNYPRRTPIPRLHSTLHVIPIRDFIYHLTANFFDRCPTHPNPLVRSIGNYTLADLHRQYKKYIHKRPKHLLL